MLCALFFIFCTTALGVPTFRPTGRDAAFINDHLRHVVPYIPDMDATWPTIPMSAPEGPAIAARDPSSVVPPDRKHLGQANDDPVYPVANSPTSSADVRPPMSHYEYQQLIRQHISERRKDWTRWAMISDLLKNHRLISSEELAFYHQVRGELTEFTKLFTKDLEKMAQGQVVARDASATEGSIRDKLIDYIKKEQEDAGMVFDITE